MATSRDDFVIAIRSAFLKKANKERFSLIGLIFFSIGLILFSKLLLACANKLEMIITFLALLDLIQLYKVAIFQNNLFEQI